MIKNKMYRYLGTNGVLETYVRLEGVYSIPLYELIAEGRHILTDGDVKTNRVVIPQEDLGLWHEIPLATDN